MQSYHSWLSSRLSGCFIGYRVLVLYTTPIICLDVPYMFGYIHSFLLFPSNLPTAAYLTAMCLVLRTKESHLARGRWVSNVRHRWALTSPPGSRAVLAALLGGSTGASNLQASKFPPPPRPGPTAW